MENAKKKAIAEAILNQLENDFEAACMLSRICEKCGDKEGHKRNKDAAIMFEKKMEEAKKEIAELE